MSFQILIKMKFMNTNVKPKKKDSKNMIEMVKLVSFLT